MSFSNPSPANGDVSIYAKDSRADREDRLSINQSAQKENKISCPVIQLEIR
jgi:hypothetical protein